MAKPSPQGLDPVDVLLVRRDSRNTGEAYVLFGTAMQVPMHRTDCLN